MDRESCMKMYRDCHNLLAYTWMKQLAQKPHSLHAPAHLVPDVPSWHTWKSKDSAGNLFWYINISLLYMQSQTKTQHMGGWYCYTHCISWGMASSSLICTMGGGSTGRRSIPISAYGYKMTFYNNEPLSLVVLWRVWTGCCRTVNENRLGMHVYVLIVIVADCMFQRSLCTLAKWVSENMLQCIRSCVISILLTWWRKKGERIVK